ncbi:MAG: chemotaxis protein CheB [Candidatus Jettenia sp.]|nr:MAG: chemotaxis protein CheB [Candidatus Jettenia sp.]
MPRTLPAAVLVVLHISPTAPSALPEILNHAGTIPVLNAVHNDVIRQGCVYVAPPNHHLLLMEEDVIFLSHGPKENRHRPAIDPLFRSAANTYGPRVIGTILTGTLDDGTVGALVIKSAGGVIVVQDPADALFPDMPRSVLENVEVDYCLPLSQIASLLVTLANRPVEKKALSSAPERVMIESNISHKARSTEEHMDKIGKPSTFTCPECQGTLWEIQDEKLVRFRCRVGHAYSPHSMLAAQSEKVETALWAALRSLEENANLYRRMSAREQKLKNNLLAVRFEENLKDTEVHIETIRHILLKKEKPVFLEKDKHTQK